MNDSARPLALTVANVKSFYRDRAALFWTFAFPVLFVDPLRIDLLRPSAPRSRWLGGRRQDCRRGTAARRLRPGRR